MRNHSRIYGRFPVIAALEELSEQKLISVMSKETKNSISKQYQYLFQLDGINLDFSKDAFKEIAREAKQVHLEQEL